MLIDMPVPGDPFQHCLRYRMRPNRWLPADAADRSTQMQTFAARDPLSQILVQFPGLYTRCVLPSPVAVLVLLPRTAPAGIIAPWPHLIAKSVGHRMTFIRVCWAVLSVAGFLC